MTGGAALRRGESWRWYAGYLMRQRWALVGAVLVGGFVALANLPILWLIRHALDHAVPRGEIGALLAVGAGILAFRIAAAAIVVTATRPIALRMRRVTAAIRGALVERLHRLAWQDWVRLESARAHGRIVHETERLEHMTTALFQSVIPALMPVMVYTMVLLLLSVPLTLILLAVAIPARLLTWLATRRLRRSIGAYQQAFEAFHIATRRVLSMLAVSRLQASEGAAIADHRRFTDGLGVAGADMAAASVGNAQATSLASTFVAVATLLAGGVFVAQGSMTTGTLIAFFMAAMQVNAAIGSIAAGVPLLFGGDEALLRLGELHMTGREEVAGGTAIPDLAQPLRLERVAFGHHGNRLFGDVSMRVEPGAVTVIAAANGAGKTSLFELMLGLQRPHGGSIRLGDSALAELDLAQFRRRIGMLPQHPVLFRGSIRDNILFGRTDVAPDALAQALYRAALDPLVADLAQGLDTPVGDDGQFFSGGERQRIALARALVHRPDLLILDEPSNHLDDASMALVIERLLVASGGPTCLIATHDPRLIAVADHVYELADGRLRSLPTLVKGLAS